MAQCVCVQHDIFSQCKLSCSQLLDHSLKNSHWNVTSEISGNHSHGCDRCFGKHSLLSFITHSKLTTIAVWWIALAFLTVLLVMQLIGSVGLLFVGYDALLSLLEEPLPREDGLEELTLRGADESERLLLCWLQQRVWYKWHTPQLNHTSMHPSS